jgi:hypothetical protein
MPSDVMHQHMEKFHNLSAGIAQEVEGLVMGWMS